MQDQLFSFLQMAPQLHLAAPVTCHFTAAIIISVQQQGPIATLLFIFTSSNILCSTCRTLPAFDNMGCFYSVKIHPTFMIASISKMDHQPHRQRHSLKVLFSSDPPYEYQTVLCDSESSTMCCDYTGLRQQSLVFAFAIKMRLQITSIFLVT